MDLLRRLGIAAAGILWLTAAGCTAAAFFGEGDSWQWARLTSFCAAAAVTLTVTMVVDRFVVAPRSAYRMGWDACARHERLTRHGEGAEVIPMRSGHAR